MAGETVAYPQLLVLVAINCSDSGDFQRWLVFRRSLEQLDQPQHISYYQVFAPKDTLLATIAKVAGRR